MSVTFLLMAVSVFAGNFITDSQDTTVLEKHPPEVQVLVEPKRARSCPNQNNKTALQLFAVSTPFNRNLQNFHSLVACMTFQHNTNSHHIPVVNQSINLDARLGYVNRTAPFRLPPCQIL